jgi:hypothetical protein
MPVTMKTKLDEEIWKDIPDCQHYQASNLGRIRSLDRVVRNIGGTRIHRGKILKQSNHPQGYFMVATCHEGKVQMHAVHRLVIRAFLGLPDKGMQTCHNDGNPANNHIDNLRYDTVINNHKDKQKHNTIRCGEKCAWATTNNESVIAMRNRRAAGESLPSIAKDYNMSKANISRICRGELWKHVGGPITKLYDRN